MADVKVNDKEGSQDFQNILDMDISGIEINEETGQDIRAKLK